MPPTAPTTWQPTPSHDRNETLDVLRGLALFGVLIVNAETLFRVPLLEHILWPTSGAAGIERVVDALVTSLLEFKAVTIFSLLFGVGTAALAERAERRGVNAAAFLARRMGWLMVFGVAHLLLLWNGDVLALYALCGFFMLPLLGLSWPVLLLLGGATIALPEVAHWGATLPSAAASSAWCSQARQVYGGGGYLEILAFRWHETRDLMLPLLIAFVPRTAGLMMCGMAAWKGGLFQRPDRHRGVLTTMLVVGGVGAAAVQIALAASSPVARLGGPILLGAAYVAAAILFLGRRQASRLKGLAAVGRMAFTNYVMQSVILTFVFYGYGLGQFGRVSETYTACMGVLIFAAQVVLSRWWLERFNFGPLEWLWRSLTYGQRPPFRRRRS